MSDVVRVGPQRLIGEILTMKGDTANIQVYEETSGLGPGAEVETTGAPMSVELGPGMIEGIYDGIQRPLEKIVEKVGACITRGVEVPAVDHEKKWEFNAVAKVGDQVIGGDITGGIAVTGFGRVPDRLELLLDIGTNCEMVLSDRGRKLAAAAAAMSALLPFSGSEPACEGTPVNSMSILVVARKPFFTTDASPILQLQPTWAPKNQLRSSTTPAAAMGAAPRVPSSAGWKMRRKRPLSSSL